MKKNSIAITANWVEIARREKGISNEEVVLPPTPLWLKVLFRLFPKRIQEIETRTRMINEKIETTIEQEGIKNIIELGAGLSSRGKRTGDKYPHLLYIETDLEKVIKDRLAKKFSFEEGHIFLPFNVITDEFSILSICLDQGKTLVIAEGLMFYLPKNEFLFLLKKIRGFLSNNVGGHLVFDTMHWEDETLDIRLMRKVFVPVLRLEKAPWPNFKNGEDGKQILKNEGFSGVKYESNGRVHIYSARVAARNGGRK